MTTEQEAQRKAGGGEQPAPDLGALYKLAQAYCSSDASPHHITFTVHGLRNLIEALSAPPPAGAIEAAPVQPTNEDEQGVRDLMAMSEAEIDAELRSMGLDPDEAADSAGKAIAAAIERSGRGRFACPLCGKDSAHMHTPAEITIFRNGGKFARAALASPAFAIQAGEAPVLQPIPIQPCKLCEPDHGEGFRCTTACDDTAQDSSLAHALREAWGREPTPKEISAVGQIAAMLAAPKKEAPSASGAGEAQKPVVEGKIPS